MRDYLKQHLYSFLTILIWGTVYVIPKLVAPDAADVGSLRCIIAALLMIPIAVRTRPRIPASVSEWALVFCAGGIGQGLYMYVLNTAVVNTQAATASLLLAMSPIATAILARIVLGERIRPLGWAAIGIGFLGVAVVLLKDGGLDLSAGVIWAFGAMMLFGFYNLITKMLTTRGYRSMEITIWALLFGALVSLLLNPSCIPTFLHTDLPSKLGCLFLGLMASGVAYILWNRAIELAAKVSEVTNYMFLVPISGAGMAWAILHETPGPNVFLGGALVISGLILFNRQK
ncbi:MAG: DMT family transporter [Eubacterium sp.]|nr:DMT family transporter [Eubacterium sp.]